MQTPEAFRESPERAPERSGKRWRTPPSRSGNARSTRSAAVRAWPAVNPPTASTTGANGVTKKSGRSLRCSPTETTTTRLSEPSSERSRQTAHPHRQRRRRVILVTLAVLPWLITAVAIAMRVAGTSFDFPIRSHPDELPIYRSALRIARHGHMNPHFFAYPSLLIYFHAALIKIGVFVGWLPHPALRDPRGRALHDDPPRSRRGGVPERRDGVGGAPDRQDPLRRRDGGDGRAAPDGVCPSSRVQPHADGRTHRWPSSPHARSSARRGSTRTAAGRATTRSARSRSVSRPARSTRASRPCSRSSWRISPRAPRRTRAPSTVGCCSRPCWCPSPSFSRRPTCCSISTMRTTRSAPRGNTTETGTRATRRGAASASWSTASTSWRESACFRSRSPRSGCSPR